MESDSVTSGFIREEAVHDGSHYRELQEVYVSASGSNRLFRCERYGRIHILKTLQARYAGSDFYEQALRKEFNIGYQLEHPNICRTLGWEQHPELGRCILLEYIDGITLKEFMEQGKLTRPLACKIVTELCNALHYLHSKQIVHRDLKPSNILITHNGNNVKLIDFSLSDCDDYDILKLPAGTRYYLAPEVLQPDAPLDLRADVYSLGIILGEMATLLGNKRMAAVSRRCTQRKPERRYSSVEEVSAALVAPVLLLRRWLWSTAVVGVLALLGAGTSYYYSSRPRAFPVYGNVPYSEACRQLLHEERIRRMKASDSSASDTRQADSLQLMNRLRQALNSEFPLPLQQQSPTYRKVWENVEREAASLFADR